MPLLTISEIILLCARQDIALRGHDETEESLNPGNFRSLLTFISNHDQIVRKRIKEGPQNSKYTSPEIQNELLGVMGDMVLQTISNEVQKAGIYSLLADETKDISQKEQLSIVLRYDSIKGVPIAQDFFSLLEAVYVFLSSGKFNALFEKIQVEKMPGKQPRRLKRLIETRWACRFEAIKTFKETFGALLTTLETISDGVQRDRALRQKDFFFRYLNTNSYCA